MCGGGSQTTTTKTEIPPEVLARYNAVNARAETAAATPFQQYGGEFVAGLNPTQQAGIQSTNQYAQSAQPYFNAGAGLTLGGAQAVGPLTQGQIGYYQNPYNNYVAGATQAALQQQQGQQLSQQQADAIKGGAFGGERAGLQRAVLQGQQGLATAQALAPIYQQGYQQAVQTAQGQQGVIASDLARQMQAGQQIAGLGTGAQAAALQGAQAQIQAGTLGQQTQQAQDTAVYQQFLQERGYPYQQAQFLANIAEGTGALSGSTQTTQAPAPFFSDKRLKHDAERVGEMHDGTPIYRFKYNGSNQTQIGLMAQDVEKRHPEAVGQSHGYKTVDYEKATDEAAHKSNGGGIMPNWMGGAVANPGHYAMGGLADTDLSAILNQQKQSFGPFGQGGLYGGSQHANPYSGGMGAGQASIIPQANLHVAQLRTPSPAAAPRQTSTAGELYSNLKSLDSIASDVTGKGLFQRAGEKTGIYSDSRQPQQPAPTPAKDVPVEQSGVALPVDRARGGLIPHYADGGPVIPGSPDDQDNPGSESGAQGDGLAKVVAEGSASAPKTLQQPGSSAPAPSSQGPNPLGLAASGISAAKGLGSIGSGVSSLASGLGAGAEAAGAGAAGLGAAEAGATAAGAAGAAGGIGSALGSIGSGIASVLPFLAMLSDERVKHNKREVGKLYDGQPVYSYDFGDGRTQIGLMAQNVEHKHPEAVAETRGGLKMVDYHRATEHAAHKGHFAEGGLVPPEMREHHAGPNDTNDQSNVVGDGTPKYAIEPQNLEDMPEHRQAMIKAIYGPESGGRYDIRQGGKETFDTSGPHPGPRPAVGGESSAAGAGQFIHDTWNRVTGGAPMTKGYQDAATWKLASDDYSRRTGRDLDADLQEKGVTPEIKSALAPTWTSLGKGQPSGGLMPSMKSITQPISDAASGTGDFISRNKDIILPVLQGLGAMASSPSRYLGSAILQGLGAGAKSYSDLQGQMAQTTGQEASNLQTMQNLAFSSIKNIGDSTRPIYMVLKKDGTMMPLTDWMEKGGDLIGGELGANYARSLGKKYLQDQSNLKDVGATGTGAAGTSRAVQQPVLPKTPEPSAIAGLNPPKGSWDEAKAQENRDIMSMGSAAAKANSDSYYKSVSGAGSAALRIKPQTNEMLEIVSDLGHGGALDKGGANSGIFTRAQGPLNDLASRAGLGEDFFGGLSSSKQALEKLSIARSQMNASAAQERALGALEAGIQSLPSADKSATTNYFNQATIMADRQRQEDQWEHAQVYGKKTGNLYNRAEQHFNSSKDASDYKNEINTLQRFMAETDPVHVRLMNSGKVTPEQIDEYFMKKYNTPDMSRYFNKKR